MWRSKPALEPRDMMARPLSQELSLGPQLPHQASNQALRKRSHCFLLPVPGPICRFLSGELRASASAPEEGELRGPAPRGAWGKQPEGPRRALASAAALGWFGVTGETRVVAV